MTTLTRENIARVIDSDPELKASLSTVLAPAEPHPEVMREFIALRQLIVESVMRLESQISATNAQVVKTNAQGAETNAQVADLRTQFVEFTKRTDAEFLKLGNRVSGTHRRIDDIHEDIGDMKGAALEWRLRETGMVAIADDLGFRSAEPMRFAEWGQASSQFNETLRQAQDAGTINRSEYRRILKTDAIFRGRNPDVPAESSPYVLVEAAHHARESKVNQVLLSKFAMEKVMPDVQVVAAIYCARIPDDVRYMAEDHRVSVHISDREA